MLDSFISWYMYHQWHVAINMLLAERSAGSLKSLLTCVRVPMGGLKVSLKTEYCIFPLFLLLYALYVLCALFCRSLLCWRHWNCRTLPDTRVILLCTIVWYRGTPSTVVFRGFTAIHFLRKRFMQVIAWISWWFGRSSWFSEAQKSVGDSDGQFSAGNFFLGNNWVSWLNNCLNFKPKVNTLKR